VTRVNMLLTRTGSMDVETQIMLDKKFMYESDVSA